MILGKFRIFAFIFCVLSSESNSSVEKRAFSIRLALENDCKDLHSLDKVYFKH